MALLKKKTLVGTSNVNYNRRLLKTRFHISFYNIANNKIKIYYTYQCEMIFELTVKTEFNWLNVFISIIWIIMFKYHQLFNWE